MSVRYVPQPPEDGGPPSPWDLAYQSFFDAEEMSIDAFELRLARGLQWPTHALEAALGGGVAGGSE